jgi:adenosylmethionine---8-amino-7-oxononanoate aminotransferase
MPSKTLPESNLQQKPQTWHPCTQMKEQEHHQPFRVKKAKGTYIELENGHKMIDAISSWWCKSLGHNDPRIKAALLEQLDDFEHVILANTTSRKIEQLTAKLSQLCTSLDKVFYAGDGACAIEVALKMSLLSRKIKGETHRIQFISLQGSYHGDTSGAMSVSDCGLFTAPYAELMFDCEYIQNIPYVSGKHDPLWHDCETVWTKIEAQLEPFKHTANAVIFEPIVQGAGGMKIYSQDFLKRLAQWCKQNNVYLIADEIMTGIGRTGKMLACHHADITPDFICLSKGLTSGWLPLSVVLTHDKMYQLFYDDYESGKSFLHSHTYSGNALAVSVALKTLEIMEQDQICNYVTHTLQPYLLSSLQQVANETGKLTNIRGIGGIVAAEMIMVDDTKRYAPLITEKAGELGALLRPIGNTLYWLPPLNIELQTIDRLKAITIEALLYISK